MTPTAPPPVVAAARTWCHRWPRCPAAPRSARSSTPSWNRSIPTADDLAAEVRSHVRLNWRGRARPTRRGRARPRRCCPRCGPRSARSPTDRTLADIAPSDRLAELDFELPLRGGDRPNGTSRLGRPRDAAARPSARRRSARRLRRSARRSGARRRRAERLPQRQHRRGAARRRALRRRRLQDQPARRARSAADRVGLPRLGDGRRDAARALPAAGAALRGRVAPVPAVAACRLRPVPVISAACSTCSCAACAGRASCSTTARYPASSRGSRRPRWSSPPPTCLAGGAA